MKFISLFAGVGGFDLALERLGHECVYANEIDRYCKIIYDKHFKTKIDNRDIRTVNVVEIPKHDLLVGGFPCQAFSIAGKRRGFSDTRGTLFFEIARILKNTKPKYFILENVKGLLSHDQGRTFKTIITTLTELGYDLQWQVLNSKNFGVPQNRERVFIVGHLRGTPRPKVFPITQSYAGDYFGCVQASYYKGWHEGSYIESKEKLALRKLTPKECERLQGFPDNKRWKRHGSTDLSIREKPKCPICGSETRAEKQGNNLYYVDCQNKATCGNGRYMSVFTHYYWKEVAVKKKS